MKKRMMQLTGALAAACLMLSATPVWANPKIEPELKTWYDGDCEYAEFTIKDEKGNVITDETSVSAAAERSNYVFFETESDMFQWARADLIYFVDCGVIKAYNRSTGEKAWTNYDFQGNPDNDCYAIGEDGTLYTAGYTDGPDLFAVNYAGKTLIRVSHLDCNNHDGFNMIGEMVNNDKDNQLTLYLHTYDDPDCYIETISIDQYMGQIDADEMCGQQMKVANCKNWVSLRLNASTSSEKMITVPLGATVTCLSGSTYNGFYYVEYNGYHGYILKAYLNKILTDDTPLSGKNGSNTRYVANCKEWITLRKEPSVSAKSLGHIPLGASVTYISDAGNGFSKITYNGKTGYVLSQYLSKTK